MGKGRDMTSKSVFAAALLLVPAFAWSQQMWDSSQPRSAAMSSAFASPGPQHLSGKPSMATLSNGPVAEVVSDSSATIGWQTARPAKMQIRYGTAPDRLDQTATAKDSSNGLNHHVTLEKLAPSTQYYFQVMQGNNRIDGVGTFETVARGARPVKADAVIPE